MRLFLTIRKCRFSSAKHLSWGGGGTNVTMNKHRNALKTHHGRTRLHVKNTKKFMICIIAIILAMVSASIAMFSFADGDSGHGGNSGAVYGDATHLQFAHWEDFADNRQGKGSASVTYFMNKIASNDPSKGSSSGAVMTALGARKSPLQAMRRYKMQLIALTENTQHSNAVS